MKGFLENLRGRTEAEKQSIAFGVSGVIVFIIFVVWFVYITKEISRIEPVAPLSDDALDFVSQLKEGVGLFQDNLSNAKEGIDGIILEDGEVFVDPETAEITPESSSESTQNVLE